MRWHCSLQEKKKTKSFKFVQKLYRKTKTLTSADVQIRVCVCQETCGSKFHANDDDDDDYKGTMCVCHLSYMIQNMSTIYKIYKFKIFCL